MFSCVSSQLSNHYLPVLQLYRLRMKIRYVVHLDSLMENCIDTLVVP